MFHAITNKTFYCNILSLKNDLFSEQNWMEAVEMHLL